MSSKRRENLMKKEKERVEELNAITNTKKKESEEKEKQCSDVGNRKYAKPNPADIDSTTPVEYIHAREDDASLRMPSQNWMVLSYVAPASDKSVCSVGAKNVMIKVSGVFPDEEAAKCHAGKIRGQSHHKIIDTFVVPPYVWLSIPMPKAAEMYCRRIYVDQPMLNKLMDGQWKSTENARNDIKKRKTAAYKQNLRKLRLQYNDPTYTSPHRSQEEVDAEQEKMASQSAPPSNEEQMQEKMAGGGGYSTMDMAMMFAKFLLLNKPSSSHASSTDTANAPP